jgi:integrase
MARKLVKIEVFRERLRLRWSYRGQRYTLYSGLYDSPLSRTVVESKASLIEADLVTGNFDPTLEKYKGETADRTADNGVTVVDLFRQFYDHRAKKLSGNTHQRYSSAQGVTAKLQSRLDQLYSSQAA